jgi:hypothetical protein
VTTVDGSTATFTVPDGTRLLVACVQVQNPNCSFGNVANDLHPAFLWRQNTIGDVMQDGSDHGGQIAPKEITLPGTVGMVEKTR